MGSGSGGRGRGGLRGLVGGSPHARPVAASAGRGGARPTVGASHRSMGELFQPGAFWASLQASLGGPHYEPGAARQHLPAQVPSTSGPTGLYLPGTFQPTFLYESIWDLVTFGLLLLIERKVKLRRGYLFAAYASIYTFGRFFTEYLRIDPSHRYLGLRLNDWTSIGVFVVASTVLLLGGRPRPGDELVGDPLPPAVLSAERAARAARAGNTVVPAEAEAPGGQVEPAAGAASAEAAIQGRGHPETKVVAATPVKPRRPPQVLPPKSKHVPKG